MTYDLLMLARWLDTAAITARLGLSVHTVRRHTEHLMAKLGVHRVAEVGPRLLAMDGGAA